MNDYLIQISWRESINDRDRLTITDLIPLSTDSGRNDVTYCEELSHAGLRSESAIC